MHKDTTAIAVAVPVAGRARFVGTVGLAVSELLKVLAKLGEASAMRIVYEAGPCRYSLVRRLRALGSGCDVIAPAKVARRAGDRIKTDRRDALHLAAQSQADSLTLAAELGDLRRFGRRNTINPNKRENHAA